MTGFRFVLATVIALVIGGTTAYAADNPILGKWVVVDDRSGTVPSQQGQVHVFAAMAHQVNGGRSPVRYQVEGSEVTVRWRSGEMMQYHISGDAMVSDENVAFKRVK
jgi:hypothetical protein